jgi:hypothetical protein
MLRRFIVFLPVVHTRRERAGLHGIADVDDIHEKASFRIQAVLVPTDGVFAAHWL